MEGILLAKGFFEGSKTVTKRPNNKDQMMECLEYIDKIHNYADDAYPMLMSQQLQDALSGIKKLSHMIHMIRSSESKC